MPEINRLYRKSCTLGINVDSLQISRSYTIDLGNKHPSDFLKVGASEYKLTFADEWEMDGRRFSSGMFAICYLNTAYNRL